MNNAFAMVSAAELEENGKLYGVVEVDQLRCTWKARRFAIEVPAVLMESGLLPSIFDWPLLGQLMPMEQAMGEAMLQQRINDLELLNSLTTSLQRIEIRSEPDIGIDVLLGRPSYNVLVQDNGSIVVKELPSLHIHVYAVESRPAAGQECQLDEHEDDNESLSATEQQQQQVEEEEQHDEEELSTEERVADADVKQSLQLTKYQQDQQQALNFLCGNLTSISEAGDEPETDFLTESEDQADNKLHRRMSFWMRVGHFLRQNIPRLN
ncbi:hypothetical protein KR044_013143 [Drosophila immigrans]|nr:hypothetical protein KR044_013143 [Drosophila immigrans]